MRTDCRPIKGDRIQCYRAVKYEISDTLVNGTENTASRGAASNDKFHVIKPTGPRPSLTQDSVDAPTSDGSGPQPKGLTHSPDGRLMIVSSAPRCVSIDISGAKERNIPCTANPMTVLISGADLQLRVNGPTGYGSKAIQLKIAGTKEDDYETATLTVQLDRQ